MWNQRLCFYSLSKLVDNLRLHWHKHCIDHVNQHDRIDLNLKQYDNDNGDNHHDIMELHKYNLNHAYNYQLQYKLH